MRINIGKIRILVPALVTLFMCMGNDIARAQVYRSSIEIEWNGLEHERLGNDTITRLAFEGATYKSNCLALPTYTFTSPIYSPNVVPSVKLDNVVVAPLADHESAILNIADIADDFQPKAVVLQSRDEALLRVDIEAVRNNKGRLEKLVSADLSYELSPKDSYSNRHRTVSASVLSSGKWYKLALSNTGIYKLTYNDLSSMGADMSNLDPRNLRVFHNGGGVLPESNAVARHDDLVEIPIWVSGEEDGRFDESDYALFFARGPVTWTYDTVQSFYKHSQNPYDDCSYAFLTFDKGTGKRITTATTPSGETVATCTDFLDYAVHEMDEFNLAHAGRTYYGDKMDGNAEKTFTFNFPDIVTNKNAIVDVSLAGYNKTLAYFDLYANANLLATLSIDISHSDYVYGREVTGHKTFLPNSNDVSIKLRHRQQGSSSTTGYVDYIIVNAWRRMVFHSGQVLFRNPVASQQSNVYTFKLSNASQNVQIWDVTNPVMPTKVKTTFDGGVMSFTVKGDVNNEFVAFDGTSYLQPIFKEIVATQNLHSVRNIDYLIVSYKDFLDQAERLKQLHGQMDPDLSVYITTPEKIYNEFSCGAKDVTAIRDFARHLYWNATLGRELKYILLLGDASYDYKNRNGVSDFVPSYETVSSLSLVSCYVSDSYYGFMDENEGSIKNSVTDIGIGRFPVVTAEQAEYVIDKIEAYNQNNDRTMTPWRNVVTFWADDDEADFINTPEMLIGVMRENGGENMVVDKIYLDAYEQINTPSGQVSPAATEALNNRVSKGTLVLNYTGHGGEVQLTSEKVMQLGDVQSWRNAPKYPMMITATCEFSRYDDLNRTSLGEYTFLSRHGAMVAMFTTSRPTYRGPNTRFNKEIYKHLFVLEGGKQKRLGDVYRLSRPFGDEAENAYLFFGDPAMRITYPINKVRTTKINGREVGTVTDTLKALQNVTIAGEVLDTYGNKDEAFNGVVYVSVYDKEATITTLGDEMTPMTFKLLNSMLFNGKTKVENGEFEVAFIMPRDIAFNYDNGLISYYATDYKTDANGTFSDFIVGGFDENASLGDDMPQIRLFIDDTLFIDGGSTNQNPLLLAYINDKYGINTTGNGIGHDIVATLSGPLSGQYKLNDNFEAAFGEQGNGTITYNFQNLPDGEYTLKLKLWNINNISNEATLHFVVVNNATMKVETPQNIPNPCTDNGTYFYFGHNQTGNVINVKIEIFNILGQRIVTLSQEIYGSDVRTSPIYWDGRDRHGARLAVGVYPYRITATNEDGDTDSCVSKIIVSY